MAYRPPAEPAFPDCDLRHDLRNGAFQHRAGAVLVQVRPGYAEQPHLFWAVLRAAGGGRRVFAAERALQKRLDRCSWVLQYGAVLPALLRHVLLNSYGLMKDPDAEVGIYMTAMLGIAVISIMPAQYSLLTHLSAYMLFMLLAASSPTGTSLT